MFQVSLMGIGPGVQLPERLPPVAEVCEKVTVQLSVVETNGLTTQPGKAVISYSVMA